MTQFRRWLRMAVWGVGTMIAVIALFGAFIGGAYLLIELSKSNIVAALAATALIVGVALGTLRWAVEK